MNSRTFHSVHPLVAAFLTSLVAGAAGTILPPEYAATAVGLVFLGAALWLIGGTDYDALTHHGVGLGGVLSPEPLAWPRLLKDLAQAWAWGLAVALVVLPPFAVGFWFWYRPDASFDGRLLAPPPDAPSLGSAWLPNSWPQPLSRSWGLLDLYLGHLLVIALPEEAFFRGYLQTRLDDRWQTPVRMWGARLGWGLLVSSMVFAIGHVVTTPHPQRLSVFFPSLLFGWLRAKTGGVGAAVFLHANCNVFVELLSRGYGFG